MDAHQTPYDPMAMSIDAGNDLKLYAPPHPAPQDSAPQDSAWTQAEEKDSPLLSSELWHEEHDGWCEYTIRLHHSKKTRTRVKETSTKDGKFQGPIDAFEISRSDAS